MSASSKWQAPYNELPALRVIPLAQCYQRALTNADAAASEFFCVELSCLRMRPDRLNWSMQACGKERRKRSQGRTKGKWDQESIVSPNGEGNEQTQAEGEWSDPALLLEDGACPIVNSVAVIKYWDNSNLGEKEFILVKCSHSQSLILGKSRQNLKQLVSSHSQSRAQRKECMHGHSLCFASSLASYTAQGAPKLGIASPTCSLGLPTSVKTKPSPRDVP